MGLVETKEKLSYIIRNNIKRFFYFTKAFPFPIGISDLNGTYPLKKKSETNGELANISKKKNQKQNNQPQSFTPGKV